MNDIRYIDFWNIAPLYYITENGEVYNFLRNKKRKVHIGDDGYLHIALYDRYHKRKNFRVNRLVARAFLGEPNVPNVVAHHKDGNILNNHYSNLQWISYSENQYESRKISNKITDLTEDEIHKLCKMVADGASSHEILTQFGICGKRHDRKRFDKFVKRISAIRHGRIFNDVYKQYSQESSTTIENNDIYYIIDIY